MQSNKLIETKAAEPELIRKIEGVFQAQLEAQQAVEVEVKKLMQQYSSQMTSGDFDTQRMYTMIRRQVAKDKNVEFNPDEQVTLLAHQIQDRLYLDDLVDYPDEDKALRVIKQCLHETLMAEDALDSKIREKILSLKRGVPEGTPEWTILYRQYMDEERSKRSL